MKANKTIRSKMLMAEIPQWRVARELGLAETSFCRKLRDELTEDEREKVLAAIEAIASRRQAQGVEE